MHCKCDVEECLFLFVENEGVCHIQNVIFPDISMCLALNAHTVDTSLLECIIRNEMIIYSRRKEHESKR